MDTVEDRTRIDLGLRVLRVVLAIWLAASPWVLGFAGTFPGYQDATIGLALLPLMLLGLAVPSLRVVMLCAGIWLLASPAWSMEYYRVPQALWPDRIAGLAFVLLGLLPPALWREGVQLAEPAAQHVPERALRWIGRGRSVRT